SAEGGAAPGPGGAGTEEQRRLLEQIWELSADVIVADVGGDPARGDLVDLGALGALSVVVATPDGRSLRAGYDLFRRAVIREIEQAAAGAAGAAALVAALRQPAP